MYENKELEIQKLFLEEATDYLNTLEDFLLGVKHTYCIEIEKINAALRAAHSIKGGAGIMGFRILSDLAHRLEDALKVLKTQNKSLEIDDELQGLLLSSIDFLRQIVDFHSQGQSISEEWLENYCYPVFENLHQTLGDPVPEDATTILSTEDNSQDIIPLIFQTEVEESLQRLESLLGSGETSGLSEELAMMAAGLGGLGEMLQIEAFTQLCESVAYHLATTDTEAVILEIANTALKAWRNSQALILTNQFNNLPNAIDCDVDITTVVSNKPEVQTSEVKIPASPELDNSLDTSLFADIINPPIPQRTEKLAVEKTLFGDEDFVETPQQSQQSQTQQLVTPHNHSEHHENTVRIPVKQLEEINDLFSELTIERHSFDFQLVRLQKLIRNLNQRVQTLETENYALRTAYDRLVFKIPALRATKYHSKTSEENDKNTHIKSLTNKFDTLELDSYDEIHMLFQAVMETVVQIQEVVADVEVNLEDIQQVKRSFNKNSKYLQNALTQARMRPLSDIVDRFPRALRDMSVEHGKNVQLKIEGANTLIERSILESLNEPLMHMMRNAFDHGIEEPATRLASGKSESGVIEIAAKHHRNRTIITLRDDGRGIDLEQIRQKALAMGLDESLLAQATEEELLSLIFEPGFSTNEQVTSLSGRGVGMDVVRNNLKQVRGNVTVNTELGKGTTFTLSVPFTLSVARILLVECNRMLLAFPTDVVEEIFLLEESHISQVDSNEFVYWQDRRLALIRLNQYLKFNCPRYDNPDLETPAVINSASVIIIKSGNQLVAVQLDRTWGEMEVAVRQVESNIPLPPGFSNCTILGNGRVVPLVSINELLYWIASSEAVNNNQNSSPEPIASGMSPSLLLSNHSISRVRRNTILIVDDSINVRRFLALMLEKAGYSVEQAKDGQDALDKLGGGLQVEAVICDIEMPRVDGYGFLGSIKSVKASKDIPVIMLSSRSSNKHRKLAMQLGAVAYFSKPYNEQELLQALEEIIAAPASMLSMS
ncbi:hybrid sensor histidine kinase/response regulator [Mastigocoleus sp. MO_188.B34]|uniref:hybrid sensor histidine kinase/response regulator n=1 Tax=Mastigocoleus sp. MO_188.B34 TaxID=3036635 RepID=UPI00261FC52E|nr:hybrid sensor histidine kinase/response regulator [Mastigocoleus sp. MO_188.B34]MDJ0693387.1 hybrid sensor histidine kinase/response regulator [Mastigocoleus sp. MO_188.B34]